MEEERHWLDDSPPQGELSLISEFEYDEKYEFDAPKYYFDFRRLENPNKYVVFKRNENTTRQNFTIVLEELKQTRMVIE